MRNWRAHWEQLKCTHHIISLIPEHVRVQEHEFSDASKEIAANSHRLLKMPRKRNCRWNNITTTAFRYLLRAFFGFLWEIVIVCNCMEMRSTVFSRHFKFSIWESTQTFVKLPVLRLFDNRKLIENKHEHAIYSINAVQSREKQKNAVQSRKLRLHFETCLVSSWSNEKN